MNNLETVCLIDDCARRLSDMENLLIARGIKVCPFVSTTEFLAHRPESGITLVHDSADAIWHLRAGLGGLNRNYPQIAYAEQPDWRRAVSAMRSGALDYLSIQSDPTEIVARIIAVQIELGFEKEARPPQDAPQDRFPFLSKREKQVFDGVIAGLTNRSMAEKLGISYRTVEIHRANMLRKIGARNSAEAIRMSYELNSGSAFSFDDANYLIVPKIASIAPRAEKQVGLTSEVAHT